MNTPVLYDLFQAVRTHKKLTPLGLDAYFRLLQLLENGYPIRTFDELLFVCETLWLKSVEQRPVFYEVFKKFQVAIEASFEKEVTPKEQMKDEKDTSTSHSTITDDTTNRSEKEKERKTTTRNPQTEITGTRFTVTAGSSGAFSLNMETAPEPAATIDIPYLFTNDYFPISSRQLQQGWRHLRSSYAGQDSTCIDYGATIESGAREGMITNLVFEKEPLNKLELFIWIDHDGSMAAFEAFGTELVRTAVASAVHNHTKPYFFYNLPGFDAVKNDYVLLNETHTQAKTITQLFQTLNQKDIAVLLFSDAGSLSGMYNGERADGTRKFLNHVQQRAAYVSWLNPVPAHRWPDTTAEAISAVVPMFECTQNGFEKVISSLKGLVHAPL